MKVNFREMELLKNVSKPIARALSNLENVTGVFVAYIGDYLHRI